MGSKNSKGSSGKPPSSANTPASPSQPLQAVKIPPKSVELSEHDLAFLNGQTSMSREDIKNLFVKFNHNNPDSMLGNFDFYKNKCRSYYLNRN